MKIINRKTKKEISVSAFGRFNYNPTTDMYRYKGKWITGNMAEEIGIVIRNYDEAGKILSQTSLHKDVLNKLHEEGVNHICSRREK